MAWLLHENLTVRIGADCKQALEGIDDVEMTRMLNKHKYGLGERPANRDMIAMQEIQTARELALFEGADRNDIKEMISQRRRAKFELMLDDPRTATEKADYVRTQFELTFDGGPQRRRHPRS